VTVPPQKDGGCRGGAGHVRVPALRLLASSPPLDNFFVVKASLNTTRMPIHHDQRWYIFGLA